MTGQSLLLADTWMHGGWGWGWMPLMIVIMVLFWGGLIYGIVWLVRNPAGVGHERGTESPVDVLDRRFAEGAIAVDDYQARRQLLTGGIRESNGAVTDEPQTAAQAAEGRER